MACRSPAVGSGQKIGLTTSKTRANGLAPTSSAENGVDRHPHPPPAAAPIINNIIGISDTRSAKNGNSSDGIENAGGAFSIGDATNNNAQLHRRQHWQRHQLQRRHEQRHDRLQLHRS